MCIKLTIFFGLLIIFLFIFPIGWAFLILRSHKNYRDKLNGKIYIAPDINKI